MDLRFDETLGEAHDSAMSKGRWNGTAAVHDRVEYWAEGVLAYFDAVGLGAPPNDADRPITTREALRKYDPDLFALVDETMAYSGKVDWRYQPVSQERRHHTRSTGVSDVAADMVEGAREHTVELNREKLAERGLSAADVGRAIKMFLRENPDSSVAELRALPITTPTGDVIRLGEVAEITMDERP
jgi:multidrug efflux pump subunit AcrB